MLLLFERSSIWAKRSSVPLKSHYHDHTQGKQTIIIGTTGKHQKIQGYGVYHSDDDDGQHAKINTCYRRIKIQYYPHRILLMLKSKKSSSFSRTCLHKSSDLFSSHYKLCKYSSITVVVDKKTGWFKADDNNLTYFYEPLKSVTFAMLQVKLTWLTDWLLRNIYPSLNHVHNDLKSTNTVCHIPLLFICPTTTLSRWSNQVRQNQSIRERENSYENPY